MNRNSQTSLKPALHRPALPAHKPESKYPGIDQRHWVKFFIAGLFLTTYGSLEFMAGKPEISNIFNDPVFASYWVLFGLLAIFAGLLVRTWGSR